MTPDQVGKVHVAAGLLASYCRGDSVGLDVVLAEDAPDVDTSEVTDGLILLAAVVAGLVAEAREVPYGQVLDELPERDEDLVPDAQPRWREGLEWVRLAHQSQDCAPSEALTGPVVRTTAFNIALALLTDIAARRRKSPTDMARLMMELAATEET